MVIKGTKFTFFIMAQITLYKPPSSLKDLVQLLKTLLAVYGIKIFIHFENFLIVLVLFIHFRNHHLFYLIVSEVILTYCTLIKWTSDTEIESL